MQTVKNKTTVLILVFKEFLQTSIRPLISVLYAKGYHDFLLKNVCLPLPKNFAEEPFSVSENFWYRKKLGIRQGRASRFSVKIVLSHTAEKLRRGTLYGVTNFGYQKTLYLRRLCHDFLSKNFCLTVPKHFVEELFCAVFQKIYGRGEVSSFSSEKFLSHCAKNFVEEPLSVSLISGTEIDWMRRWGGVSRYSFEFSLSHSAKNFVVEPP